MLVGLALVCEGGWAQLPKQNAFEFYHKEHFIFLTFFVAVLSKTMDKLC